MWHNQIPLQSLSVPALPPPASLCSGIASSLCQVLDKKCLLGICQVSPVSWHLSPASDSRYEAGWADRPAEIHATAAPPNPLNISLHCITCGRQQDPGESAAACKHIPGEAALSFSFLNLYPSIWLFYLLYVSLGYMYFGFPWGKQGKSKGCNCSLFTSLNDNHFRYTVHVHVPWGFIT